MVVGEHENDLDGNAYGPEASFFGTTKLPVVDRPKRVERFVPALALMSRRISLLRL